MQRTWSGISPLCRPPASSCGFGAAVLLAGCDLMVVKQQQQKAQHYCELQGTIHTEHAAASHLVVVLLQHRGAPASRKDNWALVDHFVLERPGSWFFFVPAGQYTLGAFEDVNRNQRVEPDEPALPPDVRHGIDCASGTTHRGIALVVPEGGRITGQDTVDIADLQVRSVGEQLGVTLGQRLISGHVTSLDDPRFNRENAMKGLWRPFDFIMEGYAGVYFLQPYDPDKVPVLFVHGINGTPLDFAAIIARLDQSRFQPWVFYYPSGAQLARAGKVLAELLVRLQAERSFRRLFLVAHSMGGLVSREALLSDTDMGGETPVRLFITIASPWNGHAAAQIGVDHAPAAVYSWIDIAPGSRFLTGALLRR